jgi:hypothetical protein
MRDEKNSRKPFVAQEDRPEVRIKLDTPINELRVRDLATILRLGTNKDFWDGKDWQKDDFDGGIKWWKEKDKEKEKDKDKDKEKEKEKEKREKPEIKEVKAEKVESDAVFTPGPYPRPDPQLDQVMRALVGLTERVSQLADQVEELKKQRKG